MIRAKPVLITLSAFILVIVGFLFFRGAQPEVILAAERLFRIGGFWVTNTIFTAWFVVAFLAIVLLAATRKMALIPSGLQNLVEALFEWALDIVEGIAGPQHARRFFPLVITIFLYVMIGNWMGLLPGFASIGVVEEADHGVEFVERKIGPVTLAFVPLKPKVVHKDEHETEHAAAAGVSAAPYVSALPAETASPPPGAGTKQEADRFVGILVPAFRSVNTDVNMTLAIALFSFVFVEWWGLRSLGIRYLGKFFNVRELARGNIMGIIDVFVGILELFSEFIRIVSFTFRLFGNIFAGEVLLLMMTFLVPFVFVQPFYFLEIFVGFIQAAVFALLTLVFATMAVESHAAGEHAELSEERRPAPVH